MINSFLRKEIAMGLSYITFLCFKIKHYLKYENKIKANLTVKLNITV